MKSFSSLEELNQFLTEELGLPPLPEGSIPNLDEAIGFKVRVEDEADQPSEVDGYIDFSTRQLEHVMAQRDEARELYEAELANHMQCHSMVEQHIKQVRAQGYAEAIAAGLYPGTPFERLPEDQQETLMRRAHASIAQIDDIRETLAASDLVNGTTTKH
jgi:flagellar biosynthesis/type III secretory pathway protein FliH